MRSIAVEISPSPLVLFSGADSGNIDWRKKVRTGSADFNPAATKYFRRLLPSKHRRVPMLGDLLLVEFIGRIARLRVPTALKEQQLGAGFAK